MKQKKRLELKEKGWTELELKKTENILGKITRHEKHFSKIVFWSALITIIFANLVVSIVLIPFLLVFPAWLLYGIVVLLAGSVGFLYDLLIMDIGHLKTKHHVSASILIPLIAIVNMVVMVLVANNIIMDSKVTTMPHNPWITAIVFAVAFILPYVFMRLFKK